jgi:hypothetical protein
MITLSLLQRQAEITLMAPTGSTSAADNSDGNTYISRDFRYAYRLVTKLIAALRNEVSTSGPEKTIMIIDEISDGLAISFQN